jgi:hypothetical protein
MGSYVFGAHLLAHGGWSSTLLRPGTLRWAWPTARVFAAHSAAACVSSLSRCAAVVLLMWVHMQRVLRLQGCVPVLVLLCCDVCLLVHHVDTCEGSCDCAGQMQLSQLSRVSHGGPCACAVNAACQTAECCALQSFVPSCHRRSLIKNYCWPAASAAAGSSSDRVSLCQSLQAATGNGDCLTYRPESQGYA